MSECKPPRDPFIGSGRLQQGGILATPKQTFNSHLGGNEDLRHCASHINMSPPLDAPFTAPDVQTTLELLAARPDGYDFFITVGDGVSSVGDFTGSNALNDALDYIKISGHTSEVMVILQPGNYTVSTSQVTSSKVRLWGMYTGDSGNLPTVRVLTPTNDAFGRPTLSISSAENVRFLTNNGDPFTSVSINSVSATSTFKFDFYLKNCIFENVGFIFSGQRTTQDNIINLLVENTRFIQTISFTGNPLNVSFLSNTVPDNITLRNCQFLGCSYAFGSGTHASLPATISSKYQNIVFDNCNFNIYYLENSLYAVIQYNSIVSGKPNYIWVDYTKSTVKIINTKIKGVSDTIGSTSDALTAFGLAFKFVVLKARDITISNSEIYGPNSYYTGAGSESNSMPALYLEPQSNVNINNNIIKGSLPIQISGTTAFSNVAVTNTMSKNVGVNISNNELSAYHWSAGYSLYGGTMISIDINSSYENVPININNNNLQNFAAPTAPYYPEIVNQVSAYTTNAFIQVFAEEASINIKGNTLSLYGSNTPLSSTYYTNLLNIAAIHATTFTSAASGEGGSLSISENNIYYNNQNNGGGATNKTLVISANCGGPLVISGNNVHFDTNATFTQPNDRYFVKIQQISPTNLNQPFIVSGNNFYNANTVGSSGVDGTPGTAPRNAYIYIVNGVEGTISGNSFYRSNPNTNTTFTSFEDNYRIFYHATADNEIVCERNKNQREETYIRVESNPGDFSFFIYGTGNYKPSNIQLNKSDFNPAGQAFVNTTSKDDISGFPGAALEYSIPSTFSTGTNSTRFKCHLDKYIPKNTYVEQLTMTYSVADASRWTSGTLNFDLYKSVANGAGFVDIAISTNTATLSALSDGVINTFTINPSIYKNITKNRLYVNFDAIGLAINAGAATSLSAGAIRVIYTY